MNQIEDSDLLEKIEEEEPVSPWSRWVYRLLALFLLLVFLVPILVQSFLLVQKFLQPEVLPTPAFFDKIFHG
jgi:hypothetical protein